MSFLDVRFPTGISYGAVGGPGYSTDVVMLNSGFENRNQNWEASRCSYEAQRGCNTDQDRIDLIAFFRVAKGRKHSFRWKDWSDFEVLTGEGLLTSLGGGTFQLIKRYSNGVDGEDRVIRLPRNAVLKQSTTTLALGINYNINLLSGVITVIGSPTPAPTSWTGQFDVPVRFDTDMLRLVAEDLEYFKSQSIPLVEVRDLDD